MGGEGNRIRDELAELCEALEKAKDPASIRKALAKLSEHATRLRNEREDNKDKKDKPAEK